MQEDDNSSDVVEKTDKSDKDSSLYSLGTEEEKGRYWADGAEASKGQRWQGKQSELLSWKESTVTNLWIETVPERIPLKANLG